MRKYKKEWHRAEERLAASGGRRVAAVCGGRCAAGGGRRVAGGGRRARTACGTYYRRCTSLEETADRKTARPQDCKTARLQDHKTLRVFRHFQKINILILCFSACFFKFAQTAEISRVVVHGARRGLPRLSGLALESKLFL